MGLCKKLSLAVVVLVLAVLVPPLLLRERITTWSVRDPLTLVRSRRPLATLLRIAQHSS